MQITDPLLDEEPPRQEERKHDLKNIIKFLSFCCSGLLISMLINMCIISHETTLEYVFEINRHGARAPTTIWHCNDTYGFTMKFKGMLTPIGMRQRYLLGKYDFHLYGKKNDFNLSDMIGTKDLNIYSTNFYRTI